MSYLKTSLINKLPITSFILQQILMSTIPEYLDLHINLEDVPDYDNVNPELTSSENYTQFVGQFIQKLQQAIISNNKQQLHNLYEGDYAWGINKYQTPWIEAHEVEEACDIQINLTTQSIYNELSYRPQFKDILKQSSIEKLAEKSWQNFLTIFENIRLKEKFTLTEGWICDILDNFVSEFKSICHWNSEKGDLKGLGTEFWNVKQMETLLQELYSGLIVNGNLKLPEQMSTADVFGYFALVNHFRLKTVLGQYSDALKLIQIVSLNHTIVFSKAFSSQVNLFYHASFCYFMIEKYMESVKLSQTIAIFFESYKAFIKQSMNEKKLTKLSDKILALWCLANIFEGNQPHDLILGILNDQSIITKQRNYQQLLIDKYEKLSQFDQNTFLQLFNFSAPMLIDCDTLKIKQIEGISQRFENLKKINLNTILKLYSRIELPKLARFLQTSEQNIDELLKEYGKSKASSMETPWERTILKSLLKFEGQYTVQVKDNIVHIQRSAQKKDGKDYTYLLNGINDIGKNLAKV